MTHAARNRRGRGAAPLERLASCNSQLPASTAEQKRVKVDTHTMGLVIQIGERLSQQAEISSIPTDITACQARITFETRSVTRPPMRP
jgi:hypothetical protein